MDLPADSILRQPLAVPVTAPASVKRRVAARVIDYLVHYVVYVASAIVAGVTVGLLASAWGQPLDPLVAKLESGTLASRLIPVLGYLMYHALCEGLSGATLGKRMLGIHVASEDGTPCSLNAGFVRSFWFVVDSLFFGFIGLMAMNGSADRQRIGDRSAHTVVLETNEINGARSSGWVFVAVLLTALFADAVICGIAVLSPVLF